MGLRALVLAGILSACPVHEASAGSDGVRSAEFSLPSTAYGHAVLGPGYEWTTLTLHGDDGTRLSYRDEENLVFEDIAPRLVDLDGDGDLEAIVIESSFDAGSRLGVWGSKGRIAATPFIGRRHRWLAPIGAADLDGDGIVEIAYVETPHLGKTLKIVHLQGNRLVPVAQMAGLTNHKFGDPFMQGRISMCNGKPVILTANADWTRVIATSLVNRRLIMRDVALYRDRSSFENLTGCR
jgi:hypothetical protein